MKLTLRILLVFVSPLIAYFSAMWGERFTLAPLRSGGYEGTPLTAVEFFTVFPLILIALLIAGHFVINRYFPSTHSK
jgi:hypothetical protein